LFQVLRYSFVQAYFAKQGIYFLDWHEIRESNPDGDSGAMYVGDREAILRYDRVPEVSKLQEGTQNTPGIMHALLPSFLEHLYVDQKWRNIPKERAKDYRRAVYSANGVLHIIDQELGVILVDEYGNVM